MADFNNDGTVDGADFLQKQALKTQPHEIDPKDVVNHSPGEPHAVVDGADYTVWRNAQVVNDAPNRPPANAVDRVPNDAPNRPPANAMRVMGGDADGDGTVSHTDLSSGHVPGAEPRGFDRGYISPFLKEPAAQGEAIHMNQGNSDPAARAALGPSHLLPDSPEGAAGEHVIGVDVWEHAALDAGHHDTGHGGHSANAVEHHDAPEHHIPDV